MTWKLICGFFNSYIEIKYLKDYNKSYYRNLDD